MSAEIAAKLSSAFRAQGLDLLEPPITDGRQQWLAAEALLKVGEPYFGRFRDRLQGPELGGWP